MEIHWHAIPGRGFADTGLLVPRHHDENPHEMWTHIRKVAENWCLQSDISTAPLPFKLVFPGTECQEICGIHQVTSFPAWSGRRTGYNPSRSVHYSISQGEVFSNEDRTWPTGTPVRAALWREGCKPCSLSGSTPCSCTLTACHPVTSSSCPRSAWLLR